MILIFLFSNTIIFASLSEKKKKRKTTFLGKKKYSTTSHITELYLLSETHNHNRNMAGSTNIFSFLLFNNESLLKILMMLSKKFHEFYFNFFFLLTLFSR